MDENTYRLFFALSIPDDVKTLLADVIKQLRLKHDGHLIHWIKPHNLHITLQFLASVKPFDLDTLKNNVRLEIESASAFSVTLQKLELFPNAHRPRVIIMSMDQHEPLSHLAVGIGRGIKKTGYETAPRPFREHLSLAQVNRVERDFLLTEIELPIIPPLLINEVTLYQSTPSHDGPLYTVLERIGLKR